MWTWVVAASVAMGIACPKYSCIPLYLNTCLQVSHEDVTLASCRPPFECPAVSLNNLTNQTCAPATSHTAPAFQCLPRSSEGETCGPDLPCAAGLYCNSNHTCHSTTSLGSSCSHLRECGGSFVCNQGVCIPIFSQHPGSLGDSRMACTSGLVRDGICQPPVLSREPLPVMCSTDQDCIGSDLSSASKCECGVNHMGFAYCGLHASDRPVLRFLKAIHSGELEEAAEIRYWVVNYPRLVESMDCLESAVVELRKVEMLDMWEEFCAGQVLGVIICGLALA